MRGACNISIQSGQKNIKILDWKMVHNVKRSSIVRNRKAKINNDIIKVTPIKKKIFVKKPIKKILSKSKNYIISKSSSIIKDKKPNLNFFFNSFWYSGKKSLFEKKKKTVFYKKDFQDFGKSRSGSVHKRKKVFRNLKPFFLRKSFKRYKNLKNFIQSFYVQPYGVLN